LIIKKHKALPSYFPLPNLRKYGEIWDVKSGNVQTLSIDDPLSIQKGKNI
jgi:hypothetical protein